MRTNCDNSERRSLLHWLMRAVFGVSLMFVSSLATVQQRAAAFEEECEILEMRHDAEQVGLRSASTRRAPGDRPASAMLADGGVIACRNAQLHTEPLTGHRLSSGQMAPLVC